jgi:hypothetical protein
MLPTWIVDIIQDQECLPLWITEPMNDRDMPISSVAFFHEKHDPITLGNSSQDPSDRWVKRSRNPLLGPEHAFENGSVSSRAVSSRPEANMSLAEIQAWAQRQIAARSLSENPRGRALHLDLARHTPEERPRRPDASAAMHDHQP